MVGKSKLFHASTILQPCTRGDAHAGELGFLLRRLDAQAIAQMPAPDDAARRHLVALHDCVRDLHPDAGKRVKIPPVKFLEGFRPDQFPSVLIGQAWLIFLRHIGRARNQAAVQMMNPCYNLRRYEVIVRLKLRPLTPA
jgi:hypothetical protein